MSVQESLSRVAASTSVKLVSIHPIVHHLNKSYERFLSGIANNVFVPKTGDSDISIKDKL